MNRFLCLVALTLLGGESAWARLGENEAQSATRYGAAVEGLVKATEKPLIEGAKELAYNFEGWRVRVAFLNNLAARVEYIRIPEPGGGFIKLTDAQIEAILEGEKGTFRWREVKPRTGNSGLDKLKTAFDGRLWERSDHAQAKLLGELILTVQSREVEAYEKKTGKQPGKATPVVPKF